MDGIRIVLPLKNEYLTTVRLACGGVCALAEFDLDETEDVKVCTTESLLILKRNGFTSARVEFTVGEKLSVCVTGEERGGACEAGAEADISFALLDALIGGAIFEKEDDGRVKSVRFEA